jgi:4-carboxymuconolactone decarboxylase
MQAMQRFAPLDEAAITDEQRIVRDAIASGPRGAVRGPFNALLRSPELADRAQKLGEYVRYNSSLPARLSELAILVVARYWTAQYEWYAHSRLALAAGLAPRIVDDIAQGRRPAPMQADESAVYEFCRELHEKKSVGDAAYKAVYDLFGERGAVDLVGISGYYTLVSMVLNLDRAPLPADAITLPEL